MLRKVAVLVEDGVEPFGLGSLCEVWGEPEHPEDGTPGLDFVVVTPRPGRVRGRAGFDLFVEHGLDEAADADLVCVAPREEFHDASPETVRLLQQTHERGAITFAHCSAVFTLGYAGLLDGRRCTTHWRFADQLAATFPAATVEPDVLYVREGTVLTGAGSAASLDASLSLVRDEFGPRVAAAMARRIVVAPHRSGGQAQFLARPVPVCEDEALGELLAWVVEHLSDEHTVETLARRCQMSPRTFARRFKDEVGSSPHAWLVGQRVAAAEELLETTDRPIEWIATEVGFGNAATLRLHLGRARGLSPQAYRRSFAC